MRRILGWVSGMSVVALVACGVAAEPAHARTTEPTRCAVTAERELERAAPEAVGFDADRLAAALDFAAQRNRFNVRVFRHNCLVGEGPTNARSGNIAWNVWSVTKSVVSLVAGIAWDRGLLDLSAPIDRYLPPGLGDARHRAITVENLLTESSGLRVGAVTEGLTAIVPIDPNSAVQALGVPFDTPPGTEFTYSQRNVDLLTYVVELAVGEPFQRFAQRELFDPLGIEKGDYYWARDRSGHTYGYAHLMIPPNDLSRLALLLGDDGRWGEQQVVSSDYLRMASRPSATNPCYGYLFWVGAGCVEMPAFLPRDSYLMSGLGLQNVFVIPEWDLEVVWTGAFGNHSVKGLRGLLQTTDELSWEFFRRLVAAMRQPPVSDPGPYSEQPIEIDPRDYIDPEIIEAIFGLGPAAYPGCNVLSCLKTPLAAPFTDTPPGCYIVVCLGTDPRTPGIR
ncbi:serine hydrolase domain-containing protein [Nocardia pseudobrasiliensis]|uniref:CubicO group peptidase (Beta-lactamase class C family) n=1 Tax=Nocardia pseudobrasiliensis TaxID=45979 RepID=A0A370I5F2_9NOCA|nr:serine hydrolase [Nocardia pseudobrasiliensis]RDI65952.1 CubicO group peptidase (beta-lactamase class C family) [Nocardia pseudobrasiliensis]